MFKKNSPVYKKLKRINEDIRPKSDVKNAFGLYIVVQKILFKTAVQQQKNRMINVAGSALNCAAPLQHCLGIHQATPQFAFHVVGHDTVE